MKKLLSPLSWIYKGAMQARNGLFDFGLRPQVSLDCPVVSVGNLTLGGTGKTPIVSHLLNWAKARDIKAGVVSRGYGGQIKTVAKVQDSSYGAQVFGDEPYMLFKNHSGTPIYVGPKRVSVAQELLRNEKVDLIFADDAFQHRSLARDLDLVVIDAMEPQENYQVLPAGRLRESVNAIGRAHFVLLNKANLVSPERLDEIVSFFKLETGSFAKIDYALKPIAVSEKGLLVTGVGRPESVEQLVREVNIPLVKHLAFADHYKYSEDDAKGFVAQARGGPILTTAKDAVKLKEFDFLQEHLVVLELVLKPEESVGLLYDKIISLLS